jgi:hypothetical protein
MVTNHNHHGVVFKQSPVPRPVTGRAPSIGARAGVPP